jgi:hypothetical protein
LQPEKIKRIHKILALFRKSGRFGNIGAFTNIRRIWKILALFKKSGGFEKDWRFSKNQAVLKNIGAFSKNQVDLQNVWRHAKNRQTIESWRALKSPRLEKNQRDWKILAAHLLFRLGGISSC